MGKVVGVWKGVRVWERVEGCKSVGGCRSVGESGRVCKWELRRVWNRCKLSVKIQLKLSKLVRMGLPLTLMYRIV